MPPRRPSRRKAGSSRASVSKRPVIRTKRASSGVAKELKELYAIDVTGSGSPLLFVRPSSGRWLRRVAMIGPAFVLVQALMLYILPFVSHLAQRPEFAMFRLGE